MIGGDAEEERRGGEDLGASGPLDLIQWIFIPLLLIQIEWSRSGGD